MDQSISPILRRLVPHYNEQSAQYFVDADIIPPVFIESAGYRSSVLRFGKSFNLLGISSTKELIDSGTVDPTDSIDPAVIIESFCYRVNGGEIVTSFIRDEIYSTFVLTSASSYKELSLKKSLVLKIPSIGNVIVSLTGTINLQSGLVEVHAIAKEAGVELLGYTLCTSRSNSNRRPK